MTKEGYVQKELRKVLDIALEKPDETIFIIIPVSLDDCELPRRLRRGISKLLKESIIPH